MMVRTLDSADERLASLLARCKACGIRCSTAIGERLQRGRDDSYLQPQPAAAVVFATSTEEVAFILKACNALKIPVVPYGAGTASEGQVMAPHGGVTLDLTAMDAVLSVSPLDFQCTVQPGVTRANLNRYLRDTGLFFPVDACLEASIGGMASTRASGTSTVRYGTMRENVVALQVVLPNGDVMQTGRATRKSAAGYDLTRLFVGAAGTLGIITELTVRLHPIPAHVVAATCAFPSLTAAADVVADIMQAGISVAKVEIIDALAVGMINAYSGTAFDPRPQLFFEFDGLPGALQESVAIARDICRAHGGSDFLCAEGAEQRNAIWDARHKLWYAALAARPGCHGWPTDATVPVSRIAEAIRLTREDLDTLPFPAPIVGHVGDGNFHVVLLVDRDDPEEMRLAQAANDRLVQRSLDLGGTCTGEHGVGITKRRWMIQEFGEEAIAAMRLIKTAFDPNNIMNPGKILPD